MSELMDLHNQIKACSLCRLAQSRSLAVPGAGDPEAQLMFVGEAPGYHEDRQGLPFVGAAGRLLDELLEKIGLDRSEVFITNVIKCRPPQNRDPRADEIEACSQYLDKQVALIQPRVVATLGRFSMAYFLGAGYSISHIHGQPQVVGGRIILPLFHPAAALRQERYRTALEDDFMFLGRLLAGEVELGNGNVSESAGGPSEQLSLF